VPLRLLSLIAPPLCGVCGERCGAAEPLCAACATEIATSGPLPFVIPGVDGGWAAAAYEGVPRRLVAALKFGGRLALAGVAADAVARLGPAGHGTVVPVPADPWRYRLRGFDPAALIAAELARRWALPLCQCLERAHGPRQVGKTRAQRLAARPRVRTTGPVPASSLLVDDVVTTGATAAACATALRAAGATSVVLLTAARSVSAAMPPRYTRRGPARGAVVAREIASR
jgi:predicted amidophosphoribosyltransferase